MKSVRIWVASLVLLAFGPLTFAFQEQNLEESQPQALRIAEYVQEDIWLDYDPQNDSLTSAAISTPDASFIKIHFEYFNLPEGAYVEVSSPDGKESYRYGATRRDDFTVDPDLGENGKSSFSSMSISAPKALVKLVVLERDSWSPRLGHGVYISQYSEGFSEDIIRGILGEGLYGEDAAGETTRSTCGANQRRDAVCYQSSHPTEWDRAKSVARLVIGGGSLCTGWRVSDDNRVFTNNHCTSTSSGVSSTEVWFNYQRTSCGGSGLTSTTKVSGNSLLKTDYTLDYTLFTVNNFSSITSFGNLGLDPRAAVSNEEIYIPQHGSGNPKELAIESDQNSGNVCRVDATSTNGRGTNTDIGYLCDTIGGSSGSPVLARSSHKVIALHHLGGCFNKGAKMSLIWPQVASYFNNVIPNGSGGSTGGGGGVTSLNNGQTVSGLSGSTGDFVFYKISVPAGASNLNVSISGGSGDADLYLRYGSQPTTSSYDCRPYLNGNNESCSVASPNTGDYYIGVRAYSTFSGVSLTASYTVGGGGSTGGTVSNLSGSQGQWRHYTQTVAAGESQMTISISGGTGDADLYVRFGAQPTTSSYDHRPYLNGNNETVTINNPQAGTWHISIRGYRAYSGVTLTTSF